ncbi:hypothetical protein DRB80_23065 [Salmonella enterica]|uniref:Uncharacterized protein n=1 Tax=Salmonella enterica TaxID=28901 RepID=A0A3J8T7Y1_SALER|nr:hypothetical protein [Salmonella enterica]EAU5128026.1 hypothetical protein [Salmonella enterica subsp. enterica serovar Oranienburg]ECC8719453.1 hypothetical protein [Salmonella enterica subsp. houtenae]ECU4768122.1 hypothetical protein [Salmonella enterica subsp. enterica]EAB2798952.1 hypothetical protein [Salmonella enterica]
MRANVTKTYVKEIAELNAVIIQWAENKRIEHFLHEIELGATKFDGQKNTNYGAFTISSSFFIGGLGSRVLVEMENYVGWVY